LEDALNVDRDSFNKFHPEYRELQKYVHNALQKEVFPVVYKQIDERTKARQESRRDERRKEIKEVIEEIMGMKIVLKQGTVDESRPEIEQTDNRLAIRLPKLERITTKKSQRELASAVVLMHELSLREKTREKQRDRFSALLFKLLSRW
jgi:hypothetical protein